jgi:uncharacterized membrane protein
MNLARTLILLHFFSYGFQNLVMQRAAMVGCDRLLFVYVVAAVTCVLMTPVVFTSLYLTAGLEDLHASTSIVWVAVSFLFGGGFIAVSVGRLYAQSLLPSYVFLPLSRSGLLIVLFVSVAFLEEELTWIELAAALLAFVVLVLSGRDRRARDTSARWFVSGVAWTLLAAIVSAGLQIGSKVLVDPRFGIAVPALLFVYGVNIGNMVLSGVSRAFRQIPLTQLKPTLFWGVLGGISNSIAFATLMLYLVDGDASKIYPISALSIVLPTLYLTLVGKEPMPNTLQWLSYGAAIVALVILVA